MRALVTLPVSPQLGEQLKQLVPASGLTVMDLEVEGVCIRFSPLTTAAGNQPFSTIVLPCSGSDTDVSVQVHAVAWFPFPCDTLFL